MPKLKGTAVPYFSKSGDLGWIETIEAGAIDLAASGDVLAVYQHNDEKILGRLSSGTLRLWDTGAGIDFELELPDTTLARDLAELVRRGDLKGVSFNMTVLSDRYDFNTTPASRVIEHATIREISIVPVPAYSATSLELIE